MRVSFAFTAWACLPRASGVCHHLLPQGAATQIAFISLRSEGRCTSHKAIQPHEIEIPIIFENDKLIAINKPPHISHHDDNDQLGLLSLIRTQQQQPNPSFPYPHRLYGVHRLDRVTSGILLLAKDSATASILTTKFREKEITKIYIAISGKKPKKKKQGWVKGIMTMGRRGSYKLVNSSNQPNAAADGGESEDIGKKNIGYAVTRFFTAGLGNLHLAPCLLGSSKDSKDDNDSQPVPKTAILFQPQTGKTHQLRVAAKSLGIQILGDIRYSGGHLHATKEGGDIDEGTFNDWNRTYLHASAIHFQLDENESVTIWSPPPFDHLFSSTELNDVFVSMMEKHCDCRPILDAMQNDS